MRTPIPLAVVVLLAACGGGSTSSSSGFMRVQLLDSPQRGPDDAWVTIVEFADFQCPYCGAAEPTVEEVLTKYGPDVRLVYKHFPLPQHANARPAANAAECARAQGPGPDGHFWQMHDLLFQNQASLGPTDLAGYAAQIPGLDPAQWQLCFDAQTYDARVAADARLGASVGVDATPTFVLNGEPLVGAQPLPTFEAKVEAARARAMASGIPRAEYYDRVVLGP